MKAAALTEVLSNFGDIQANIVFKEGNVVRTMAEAKNIVGMIELEEALPQTFGIYDAHQLRAALNLLDDSEIEFNEDHLVISSGKTNIKYFYSDPHTLTTAPDKEIALPSVDVSFTLTSEDLAKLRKAASALKVNAVVMSVGEEGIVLTVTDPGNMTAPSFALEVEGSGDIEVGKVLSLKMDNLKFVEGDYSVEVSDKLISKFTHMSRPVTYWVALEKPKSNR